MEHKEASRKRTIGNSTNAKVPKTEKRKAERLKSTYKVVSSFAHLEKSEKASLEAITAAPPTWTGVAQVAPVHCRADGRANGKSLSSLWGSTLGELQILSLAMIVHDCHDFFRTCAELDDAAERLSQLSPPDKILDGNDPVFVLPAIEKAVRVLEVLGIKDGAFWGDVRMVHDQVKSLFGGVWYGIFDVRANELARDYKRIREGLFAEIEKYKFVSLPTAGVKYFDQERLFGDEVYKQFSSARYDLREAGNALAFELYTACVFHLMRVAEHGLRKLALRLKVELTDKEKFMPLEFADWDKVITGIRAKIEEARRLPRGPQKQEQLEKYSNAADHCEYMKDIWRNTTSHAREPYIRPEALSAKERVENFMVFLAKALKTM